MSLFKANKDISARPIPKPNSNSPHLSKQAKIGYNLGYNVKFGIYLGISVKNAPFMKQIPSKFARTIRKEVS